MSRPRSTQNVALQHIRSITSADTTPIGYKLVGARQTKTTTKYVQMATVALQRPLAGEREQHLQCAVPNCPGAAVVVLSLPDARKRRRKYIGVALALTLGLAGVLALSVVTNNATLIGIAAIGTFLTFIVPVIAWGIALGEIGVDLTETVQMRRAVPDRMGHRLKKL